MAKTPFTGRRRKGKQKDCNQPIHVCGEGRVRGQKTVISPPEKKLKGSFIVRKEKKSREGVGSLSSLSRRENSKPLSSGGQQGVEAECGVYRKKGKFCNKTAIEDLEPDRQTETR